MLTLDSEHIVSSKKLDLSLTANGKELAGMWVENEKDSVSISAIIALDSVKFKDIQYGRKDHYSPDNPIQYKFQNASLNIVQKGDSVFLAGNIEMFSPQRGEPSKPLFIVLTRKDSTILTQKIQLKTYPNPFTNMLIAEFELPESKEVEIQLLNINGVLLYRNNAGILESGHYSLPVAIDKVTPGTYLLKFLYGKESATKKVIKIK